jgi:hypothetical protein
MKPRLRKVSFILVLIFSFLSSGLFAGNDMNKEDIGKFSSGRIGKDDLVIELPSTILKGKSEEIKINFKNPNHVRLKDGKGNITIIVNGVPSPLQFENGKAALNHVFNEADISIYADDFEFHDQVHFTTYWIFLVPAIALALIFLGIRYRKSKV